MKNITILPISYLKGKIKIPGSKSIANRAILMSSLAKGKTKLINIPNNKDIYYMLKFLKKIGIKYFLSKNKKNCIILGSEKNFSIKKKINIFTGNAGTVIRPLTSILSLYKNNLILNGEKRMRNRPIKNLVEAIRQGGGKIRYIEKKGYPPIKIQGGFNGGKIKIKSHLSSQFLTAILIAGPLCIKGIEIKVIGKITSKSYINITLKLMKKFGIKVKNKNFRYFYIKKGQKYISPKKYYIESDISSASYFLAAGLIKGKKVTITGVGKNSIQGDIRFYKIIKKMGGKIYIGNNFIQSKKSQLKGIKINMNSNPDIAMTIAILGLFAKDKTIIYDIFNWRIKESNRLETMKKEMKKIGAIIKTGKDYIEVSQLKKAKKANIKTYNDHRIAMCFSLISLFDLPITILNPECVSKSFPNYFEELKKISYK